MRYTNVYEEYNLPIQKSHVSRSKAKVQGFRAHSSVFRIEGLGFKGLGFKGLVFRVWGLGFGV